MRRFSLFFFTLLLPVFAYAITDPKKDGIPLPDPLNVNSLPELFDKIFRFAAIQVGPFIVIIFVLVGGYQMIFSGGEAEKFSKGKNTIVYTVIGYALLLMSYGIVDIIKSALTVK